MGRSLELISSPGTHPLARGPRLGQQKDARIVITPRVGCSPLLSQARRVLGCTWGRGTGKGWGLLDLEDRSRISVSKEDPPGGNIESENRMGRRASRQENVRSVVGVGG